MALASDGVDVDPTARAVLAGHVRLLLAWNAVINLTAIREPGAIARLHIADSLAAVALIRGLPHATLLDLGSGGGFPGLPLAALLPTASVTLAESVGKKAAFLEAAAEALGLGYRVVVARGRAEALVPGTWDVVAARAVGRMADLIELALPLLGLGGHLVAWKRGDIAEELAAGERAAAALGGSRPAVRAHPPDVAGAAGIKGHGIVLVRKDAPTPRGYPRDPAARARRPW